MVTAMVTWQTLVIYLVSVAVYLSSLHCGFVFDDASAIKDNQDLRPSAHWLDLFKNDFWGTPMTEERSHKSYRPLTVMTFRINYFLHGLNPVGYHVVNVLLHGIVAVLLFKLMMRFLNTEAAFVSSLYFAVHPIHTEAVSGVVGRAELLSSIMSILAILLYLKVADGGCFTQVLLMCTIALLLVVGTLCKEQCITTVGVIFAYEFICHYRAMVDQVLIFLRLKKDESISESSKMKRLDISQKTKTNLLFYLLRLPCMWRLLFLTLFTTLLLYLRLRIMDSQLPHFTEFDNPAAHATPLVRRLTHLYLVPVNLLLLLYPCDLCADWTLGSIPLVEGWSDSRNIATLLTFGLLSAVTMATLFRTSSPERSTTICMALSILVFPFLPASNLFFPVGFVVAERILYMPSMGFAMLFGLGYQHMLAACGSSHTDSTGVDEYSLFMSATKVNPGNAKMWNNVGHALEARGDYEQALGYFRKAVSVQKNDIGAHINVGRTYYTLGMLEEAERAYMGALDLFPKPRKGLIDAACLGGRPPPSLFQFCLRLRGTQLTYATEGRHCTELAYREAMYLEERFMRSALFSPKLAIGQTYFARVAPKDLMVFINLANLRMNKTPPDLEAAAQLLRRAISLRSDFVDAYQNYGSVLMKLGRMTEAEETYLAALKLQSRNPDLHYNLGVLLLETRRTADGVHHLRKTLELNPKHEPALFALASTLVDSKDEEDQRQGQKILERLAIGSEFEPAKVHFALGMRATDVGNLTAAVHHYETVIQFDGHHRSALFNLALLLHNQMNDSAYASRLLEQLLEAHPDHVKSYLLLGDIELTKRKNAEKAKQLFSKAVQLTPGSVQAKHNLCLALAEEGSWHASETCLLEAVAMAPEDEQILEHLKIIRQRRSSQSPKPGS